MTLRRPVARESERVTSSAGCIRSTDIIGNGLNGDAWRHQLQYEDEHENGGYEPAGCRKCEGRKHCPEEFRAIADVLQRLRQSCVCLACAAATLMRTARSVGGSERGERKQNGKLR